MTIQPDVHAIAAFFETLYPEVGDGYLVLSSPDAKRLTPQGKPALRSAWFDLRQTPWSTIVQVAARRAESASVYYGVVLQHPSCDPNPFRRGKSASGYVVPGLWFDLDLAYGQHAASRLPATDDEALGFLAGLPAVPSLVVHSGGGMYGYWLFREPYVITSEAERAEIAVLSKRFTATLVAAGTTHGWTLDALGDLARVLRPVGTLNRKYGKPVTLLQSNELRYTVSDFDWLQPLPAPSRATIRGVPVTGQPDLVCIAAYYGADLGQKSRTELAGAHPQHGSSTGSNFNVNTDKELWHCHRHGTGGDALTLIAVCEGLLACEQATAGALRGDLFRRVVQIANDVFQAGIEIHGPGAARQWYTRARPWRGQFCTIAAQEVPSWRP